VRPRSSSSITRTAEWCPRRSGPCLPFALEAFTDVGADVRQSIANIQASPFLQHKNVHGFVYEVEKGSLRDVT
jgi:carbonic anhydrase